MTAYDAHFPLPVAFPKESVTMGLGEVVSQQGMHQLRLAETEKYAHVTYFFNGGVEEPLPLEDRILVPSPREVQTYDQKPAMSAREVTDKFVEAWQSGQYDLVVCNLANGDMVGHTGVLSAAVEACTVVDECVGRMVAARARSQEVKTLVARLAAQDRHEQEMHLRVYRPWGWYETLALGERFQVTRIQVNPGAALSLPRHRHRAEHWVVIAGEGLVRVGDEEMHLHVDQSVYIPQKTMHRLSNASAQPLEIVEVQTGDYLGEDDIERFDDRYGRE